MIKLANIVSTTNLVNHTKLEYINYYDQQISFAELDNTIPTLYVGWENIKKSNPNNVIVQSQSILEKRVISKNLYWEFSFEENKSQHVSGVDMFVTDAPFYYFSDKYKYVNYDPIFFGISSIEELMRLLPIKNDVVDCTYNFKNEMLYILKNDQIFGVDIKMYKYFDFDVDKIISIISENSAKYVFDEDGSIYQKYYKILPFFDQIKRYLVVLV